MNKTVIEFDRCKECLYCVRFCPQKVLEQGEKINKMGYYPPFAAHAEKCTACGICARMCPDAAITVFKEEK